MTGNALTRLPPGGGRINSFTDTLGWLPDRRPEFLQPRSIYWQSKQKIDDQKQQGGAANDHLHGGDSFGLPEYHFLGRFG